MGKASRWEDGQVTWFLTSNGEREFGPGDIILQGNFGSDGQPFNLPLASLHGEPNPGSSTTAGGTVIVDLASGQTGCAYQVFLSRARIPDGVTDGNGQAIGIDTTEPPPADWDLQVRGARGALRWDGGAQYQISIPLDRDLMGLTFYAVAAMDLDGDGAYDIYTEPQEVLITAP
ncbi:MAG: hypothetical protein HY812_13495 [Planctomycetes bacterium]|nr:hypothetical protein [Planctomycetota bacterium]